ncbi:hypothetical protein FRC01_011146 [Tulasnella sp. 417]|nr:hypothetical protein FRC01_011146 [Tulasnella sp. 417]
MASNRPARLDVSEQALGSPTATRGQVERPNSPGQDSSADPPVIQGQRKRVRTSEEGYRPSASRKRPSAAQGSPLNPQSSRGAPLSPSMAHRRRAAMENAFEHNPMYDEGMEIFQDPLTSKSAMETRILELQRRTREIGPAPLSPKSPPQTPPIAYRSLTPTSSPNPKTPQSTAVRPSLDANVASIQRRGHNSLDTRRSPTPGGLSSPVAPHVRSMSPLAPRDAKTPSPEPLRRVETLPTGPSHSPSKDPKAHGRTSIGQFISDMARKGKGKEKEVDSEDILHFNQSVASIRAGPVANDPAVMQRVSTVVDQLGRRYGLINRALKVGEPPPNPLAAIRWRKKLLENPTPVTRPFREPSNPRAHFDLPPIIDEETSADSMIHHIYSQEEIDSLAWVRSLNTLHLQEVASEYGSKPGIPEMMDWHLTAGVVEGYAIAAKRAREEEARKKQFGVLRESPASSDTSFFHGRESLEHQTMQIGDTRTGAALSPRSSTSASSKKARHLSGPGSFRFPFSSPKAPADALSVSSSSQKSTNIRHTSQPHFVIEDLQSPRSDGTETVVNSPDARKVTPSSMDSSAAAGSGIGGSRRSSIDFGFTSDEPPAGGKAGRRRIRNSLPGIIDSSRNSLSQFLSPITGGPAGSFNRSPIVRTQTAPYLNSSPLASKESETEKLRSGHLEAPHSDDGESGRSSLSDNVRSPIINTSDDGRQSFTALEKMRQRVMGRTPAQPALSELVESERDNLDASRTSSMAQLPRPKLVSPDGVDISSSEDDFSFKRNLANSRAGRKMAQSWNALTKRDQKANLYDEREEQLAGTGPGDPATGAHRAGLFRIDTGATERPGTRSDHMLRAGKRRSLVKLRPITQEEEEIRLAKKRQLELKERTAYEQRLSLVMESRRQSEAVNHILQIALRAVSDYTTRQAALLDSLGVTLHPHIPASIFDTLEPVRSSDQPGWRGIEEDLTESSRRHDMLDEYLDTFERESLANSQSEDHFMQTIMDVIPTIFEQIGVVEEEGQRLEEEMRNVEELQSELQQSIDKQEAKVLTTVETIEAGYPELAKNDALANKLKLDNATQLFPSEWPSWLKDSLYIASPFVDWLANVILRIYSSWKTQVPYPLRNLAWMTFYVGFNAIQAGFTTLVLLYHSQYRKPVLMATFAAILSFVFRNVLYRFFGLAFTSPPTVQVSPTS